MAVVNFTFSPQTSIQQMLAFEMAGQLWSNYLQDDITVDIQVAATSALPDNVLGGALPTYVEVDVAQVKAALAADATSGRDTTALANLQVENGFSVLLEDETYLGQRITLTQAQAEALGISYADSKELDGQIIINDLSKNRQLSWDEDLQRNGEMEPNTLDLLGVALHEIGHILGFISGVDAPSQGGLSQQLAQTTLLDLFRYSDRSLEQNSRELTRGAAAYFSLDGGQTSLANFSTGIVPLGNYADGYQASHWGPGNAAADRRLSNDLKLEGSSSENLQAFVQILFDLSFEVSEADWVDSPNRLFAPPNQQTTSQSSLGEGCILLGGLFNLVDGLLGSLLTGPSSGAQQTLAPQSSDEAVNTLGIMDPSVALGDRSSISDLDLSAFDAIGYDLTNASTANPDYSQLRAQAELSLAARLGIEVEELRDALQGNLPEQSNSSPASSNSLPSSLENSRLQALYNSLAPSASTGLYERRRAAVSSSSASFWQEEGFDVASVQIISNGRGNSAEIILDNRSLNVTQVQAIPSVPLILRTQNLRGDDANDLILPAYDEAQTLETGNGNNVAVLGRQGGQINGGLGNDTLIVQGGKTVIQDLGGDNVIWTKGTKDDNQSIRTGDGNDTIYFEPLDGTANSGSSSSQSGGLLGFLNLGRLLQPSISSTYEVNAGSGNNVISIQGYDSQAMVVTTGNGNDIIRAQGKNAKITTGGGSDIVILGDVKGAYFQGSGHATLSDFDSSDKLQLFGKVSDYRIQRNQLLYRNDVIAQFENQPQFSLNGPQVTYVGLGNSQTLEVDIPFIAESLNHAIDRYSIAPEITYSIVGGRDSNQFQLDPISGQLNFKAIASTGSDADQDNIFEVTVAATQFGLEGQESIDRQDLRIRFNDFGLPETSRVTGETLLQSAEAGSFQNATENDPLISAVTDALEIEPIVNPPSVSSNAFPNADAGLSSITNANEYGAATLEVNPLLELTPVQTNKNSFGLLGLSSWVSPLFSY